MRAFQLLLATTLLSTLPTLPTLPTQAVELCHIANAGFHIKGENGSALIDAHLHEKYRDFSLPNANTVQAIVAGKPPYDKVALSFSSHFHRDHFQAQSLILHAQQNPDTQYFMPPQAKAEVQKLTTDTTILTRIDDSMPAFGEQPIIKSVNGISVKIFRIDHGNPTENIGYQITMDGYRIFHTGDISATREQLQSNGLTDLEIDYLLLPYWYGFDAPKQVKAVKASWRFGDLILMHFTENDQDWMQKYGGRIGVINGVKRIWPAAFFATEKGACHQLTKFKLTKNDS